ncbi:MAG: globin domain-containing protein [Flavitalea sp.]
MTQRQVLVVQKSWKIFRLISPDIVGDVFYSKLFLEMPSLKKMFRNPMEEQHKKLIDMLSMIVGRLHHIDDLANEIQELGKRHAGYGVKPSHYKLVGATLIWTLQQGIGQEWNDEIQDAWETCYETISEAMIASSAD